MVPVSFQHPARSMAGHQLLSPAGPGPAWSSGSHTYTQHSRRGSDSEQSPVSGVLQGVVRAGPLPWASSLHQPFPGVLHVLRSGVWQQRWGLCRDDLVCRAPAQSGGLVVAC